MDRLWGALGLCQKAGALAAGFDAVGATLTKQTVAALLFARDVSVGTRKRIEHQNTQDVPVYELPYNQQDLAAITRKPVGVLAVTNKDLAALCAKVAGAASQTHKEEPV
jgi:ribosomal protein L30E